MLHVHPYAVALARTAGMGRQEVESLIEECAKRWPMLLIGGYTIDCLIVAAAICIDNEGDEWAIASRDGEYPQQFDNPEAYFGAIRDGITQIYGL